MPFEGRRAPVEGFESQGHKIGIPFAVSTDTYPSAVPLFVVRVADRLIVTMPGEATVEVGRRARAPRSMARRRRRRSAAIAVSGLANEFIQYITTPEEYDRQHYEGGSTMYGPAAVGGDHRLAGRRSPSALRARRAGAGARPRSTRATASSRRRPVRDRGRERLDRSPSRRDVPPRAQAVFQWQGGPRGLDRRLDRRFVAIQRRTRRALAPGRRRPRAVDRLDRRRRRPLRRALAGPAAGQARRATGSSSPPTTTACAPPASRSTAPRPRQPPTPPTRRRCSRRSPTAEWSDMVAGRTPKGEREWTLESGHG